MAMCEVLPSIGLMVCDISPPCRKLEKCITLSEDYEKMANLVTPLLSSPLATVSLVSDSVGGALGTREAQTIQLFP